MADSKMNKSFEESCNALNEDALDPEMLQLYKRSAPVKYDMLPQMENDPVVCINEKLIPILDELHAYTNITNKECAFYFYGQERKDGSIYLSNIIINKSVEEDKANFKSLSSNLKALIEEIKVRGIKNAVICKGVLKMV